MSINCVKTGCHIYLEEYGEYAYGDAFLDDSILIFRLCEVSHKPVNLPVLHYVVKKINHWFDKERTSQNINSTLIVNTAEDHIYTYGYNGKPIEKVLNNER